MSFSGKLIRLYFDYVYNPVYDLATGRLNIYRRLHEICVGKLDFRDKDRVLCVGVGTGNEIVRVLHVNRTVSIVGVDYSRRALDKARRKVLALGKEIEPIVMDARLLQFPSESFDKVLCIHLMDFVDENEEVTGEILRVLKQEGQFVISYPSDKEGARLGANILKDGFHYNMSSGNYIIGFLAFLMQMSVGFFYLPLIFRRKKSYSQRKLRAMFANLTSANIQIQEYPVYQDFIVYGRKSTKGE
jgi:ubiquinone/menaquinone biosynthesis C-methylase UbiE